MIAVLNQIRIYRSARVRGAAMLACWCVLLSAGVLAGTPAADWTFDRAGDLQGWQPNGHMGTVTVSNGVLSCRTTGSDPILELQPLIDVKTSPWQLVEIRLKADREGRAELFWTNTRQGRYGGFSQEKATRFNVAGDGIWRTYRLAPFWHPEKKIVRLRLDLYDASQFEIDSIRIVELPMPVTAERPEFDFTSISNSWRQVPGLDGTDQPGFHLGPPVDFEADQNSFVSLRMTVNAGTAKPETPPRGTLYFATEGTYGLHSFTFPIEADGREHTYNLDLLGANGWRGRIIALGLRPADEPGMKHSLRQLRVGPAPQGPPQLKIKSFAIEEAIPRAGRLIQLRAVLANAGADVATNLRCSLTMPDTMTISGTPTERPELSSLGFDEESSVRWTLRAAKPGTNRVVLKATANNAEPIQAELLFTVAPELKLAPANYPPEPKAVRGPHEVGAYYFPGWKSASQWHPIQGFPERRPVLGWYREGDPEVADWHIKWAVEHGITFFAYDWYWSRGARHLEHGLHDGYFKARYRHLLKFCLLWANHNPPGSSSHEDCIAVTRYWIEHYFRRPEHLTVDGKPVMIIFSPYRLTEDLRGRAGVKRAFEAMREECRKAGLPGLHLVACVGDAGGARQAAEEGYDAATAYNWPSLGMSGGGMYAPFATLPDAYRRHWQHIIEQSPIPLSPLPVCGGWDSRPWHGDNNIVRFGRTPELFRKHLRDARETTEAHPAKPGSPGMILVEAWNEWGEGSYIEPHQEFGFSYLDAIRDVFTDAREPHTDLTPADLGLGPYDLPTQTFQTAWEFNQGDEGWNNTMELTVSKTGAGVVAGRTTGRDPALFGPPMQAGAAQYGEVRVRMKLKAADGVSFTDSAQLFWRTTRMPESEATSVRFDVAADGQWHDYRIPVSQSSRWRGVITRLRLDPGNRPNLDIEVDSIRLERGSR